jgi:hypothetical protein
MGTINNTFFNDLSTKAAWSAGVAFQRSNALPLDKYSVFESLTKANEYLTSSTSVAYPGQVIAVVEGDKMVVYVVGEKATVNGEETTYSLGLQEIGGKIEVDGKSIQINETTGQLEIVGFSAADAAALTLPQKQADGRIKWVGIDTIVKGDGNTTYKFTLTDAKTGFVVTPVNAGVEDTANAATIGFDVYTKAEVDAAIKVLADKIGIEASGEGEEAVAATGLYKLIADEVARATTAEGLLSDRIGAAANGETAATGVYAYVDGVIKALVEGVDPDKVDALNDLIAWVEEHGDITEIKNDIKANADAIEILNGNAQTEGSVDKKIADAIAEENLDQYATKESLNDYAKKVDVYTKSETDTAITEAVRGATGGTDASSVLADLNAFKKAVKTEVWGSEIADDTTTSTTSRIDTIEEKVNNIADGAQVNVIESVIFNGKAATIANKTATIEGEYYTKSETNAEVKKASDAAATAQNTADEAKTAAGTNASNISTLQGTVGGHTTSINKNAEDIASIQITVGQHGGKLNTIEQTLGSKADSSTVTSLSEQLGKTKTDVTNLTGRVAANETEIAAINNTETGILAQAKSYADGKASANKTLIDKANEDIAKNTKSIGDNAGNITKNTEDLAKLALRVGNNETALGNVYNKTEVYTKAETDGAIASAVAGSQHLKKQIVDELPEASEAKEDTIYMILDTDAVGNDKYKEYMLIGGSLVLIGDTSTDLTNYATKEALKAVEDKIPTEVGEDNIIEVIKLGGVAAPIVDKTVDVPFATLTRNAEGSVASNLAGLIKSTANKFELVNGEVQKISTDLLVNGELTLVLNGGSATK